MVFHPERTAIVGATGPTGLHLTRELVGRGRGVRVVSRRRDHLEQVLAGLPVEIATAEAVDVESLARTRPSPGPGTPLDPEHPEQRPSLLGFPPQTPVPIELFRVFQLRGEEAAGGFSWTPDLAGLNAEAVVATLDWLADRDRS